VGLGYFPCAFFLFEFGPTFVLLPLSSCYLFANTGEPLMVSGPGPLILLAGILALVNLGTLVPVGTSDVRLSLWYLIFAWVILLGCMVVPVLSSCCCCSFDLILLAGLSHYCLLV
jgi:hypothetical protein